MTLPTTSADTPPPPPASNDRELIPFSSTITAWFLQHPVKHSIVLTLGTTIVVSGAIAFFIMVGAVPFSSDIEKNIWLEVNFQLLNAIFTLGALLDAPKRFRGLWLALAFRAKQRKLRHLELSCLGKSDQAETVRRQLEEILERVLHLSAWVEPTSTQLAGSQKVLKVDIGPFLWVWGLLNVSTVAQAVVTYTMWAYHPIESRPSLPIAIALPISFGTSLGPTFYSLYAQRRHQRRWQQQCGPTVSSTIECV